MRKVFLISDSMLTPMGLGSFLNYNCMTAGQSGIKLTDSGLSEKPFHVSVIDNISASNELTRFENIAATCALDALKTTRFDRGKTIMILSTTKGNVSLLGQGRKRISLHESAEQLAKILGFEHFTTVSNACISGVLAILMAKRLLSSGEFDHALVIGAEELSQFIVSGFQSLFAISEAPCKPFDKDRSGITLGEAGGAVVLSVDKNFSGKSADIEILGGATSNDANHISGPSRTGLELASAIAKALSESKISPADVDVISAHGTATLYNDEMEAKAFDNAGLSQTPLNSLKGYFGHTLGAAGIIETIITARGMIQDEIMPTLGFQSLGVSKDLNLNNMIQKRRQRFALKTASGFGGCNAAMVLGKIN
jgi:3-oxoacyl-[acyl-carrier-protein] synthase-1